MHVINLNKTPCIYLFGSRVQIVRTVFSCVEQTVK